MSNEERNRQRFAACAHLRPSPSSAEHHGGEMNGWVDGYGWMDRKKPGKYVVMFALFAPPPGFALILVHVAWRHGVQRRRRPVSHRKVPPRPRPLCHASASLPLVGEAYLSQGSRFRAPQDQSQPAASGGSRLIDDFEDDIDVEDNRKVRHSRSIWKHGLGWTDRTRRQRTDLDADVVDSQ